MKIMFDDIREHAYKCAISELCTTPELLATALNCDPNSAREVLKSGVDARYFRAVKLPRFGSKLCYQPTPKAAQFCGENVPKFLRAGLPGPAVLRGFLRGFVRFRARPALSFLPTSEQDALLKSYQIPTLGYPRALVALDGAHTEIFAPLLPTERPLLSIENAAMRWLPALDAGVATLNFIAVAGEPAAALKAALATLTRSPTGAARRELEALDAEIAADRTGMVAIKMAGKRAELVREIEAAGAENEVGYPWLGAILEAGND